MYEAKYLIRRKFSSEQHNFCQGRWFNRWTGKGQIKVYQPSLFDKGLSWTRSYGSWIYEYLCNQFLSPLTLRVRIPFRRGVLDTSLCDKFCQWLATGRWFSPGTPVSSTNKTDHHNINEILLKVALNTISIILFDK